MVQIDKLDYRGFHGLGYALFMLAIKEGDRKIRKKLLTEAANQSKAAADLQIKHINVVADFGEIARSIDPTYSIRFHKQANFILDHPQLSELPENKSVLGYKLLAKKGYVPMQTANEKRAFVKYQIALDYLAMYRLSKDVRAKLLHDYTLEQAKSLDRDKEVYPIYDDQLEVLNIIME